MTESLGEVVLAIVAVGLAFTFVALMLFTGFIVIAKRLLK
jgi:hypothetical protein